MRMTRTRAALATLVAGGALVLAGCSDGEEAATGGAGATTAPASPSPTAAASDFNDADVTFAQQMIPHHQQALEMAQMATERAESEEVRALAADIEAAQEPEIQTMTGWLRDWGQEVPEPGADTGMDGHGMDAGEGMAGMPGMMSSEEMEELMAASGADFDRMFLTMMIEHHEGAVEMARTEQDQGQNGEAIALAETIEAAQTAEIATMQGLLGS